MCGDQTSVDRHYITMDSSCDKTSRATSTAFICFANISVYLDVTHKSISVTKRRRYDSSKVYPMRQICIHWCERLLRIPIWNNNGVIMSAMVSQNTSLAIVYSSDYSGTNKRKHQSPAPQAFVRGIHRSPGNFPHKGPVTRKMFLFDDVIMSWQMRNRQTSHPGE